MSGNKATILIVDDNYTLRLPLRAYLERRGYSVLEAADGLEAVEMAVAHHPDIIALDVMMPVVDGYEALKRLKKNDATKDIPVLMLTAVNEKSGIMTSLATGAGDYVIKGSATITEICQRLERLLEKSKREVATTAGRDSNRVLSDEEIAAALREICRPTAMPARLAEVLNIINRQGTTIKDWMKLFENDRNLAQTAALLGGIEPNQRGGITELDPQSLVAHGANRLKYLALGAAAIAAFSAYTSRDFQRHLLLTALLARSLALDTVGGSADEAVAAGLLHDIGKVLLNNRFPNQYKQVIARADDDKKELSTVERAMMGTDHAAFGAEVLKAWNVPGEIVEAVNFHHAPYDIIVESAAFNPSLVAIVEVAESVDRVWNPAKAATTACPATPKAPQSRLV